MQTAQYSIKTFNCSGVNIKNKVYFTSVSMKTISSDYIIKRSPYPRRHQLQLRDLEAAGKRGEKC